MPKNGKLGDFTAQGIEPGLLRLDFLASVPPDHDRDDRYTMVVDLDTARSMAILMIDAIQSAEILEAKARKKK